MTELDPLDRFRTDLVRRLAARDYVPERHPMTVSPWVAMSVLQKSVRRGCTEVALRAAATLLRDAPDRLWRRLGGIPVVPTLQTALADLPKDAPTFLCTEYGRPYTAAGFGNWMRDRCNEAGLSNCSSHGLRKACARRLAEAGCTHHEIKAITGHKTDAEVRRYTEKSDQVLLARRALGKLQETDNNPKSANRY